MSYPNFLFVKLTSLYSHLPTLLSILLQFHLHKQSTILEISSEKKSRSDFDWDIKLTILYASIVSSVSGCETKTVIDNNYLRFWKCYYSHCQICPLVAITTANCRSHITNPTCGSWKVAFVTTRLYTIWSNQNKVGCYSIVYAFSIKNVVTTSKFASCIKNFNSNCILYEMNRRSKYFIRKLYFPIIPHRKTL